MVLETLAKPSFAPAVSFARSVNIIEGPVRLGGSLKVNSPASFGPILESTPYFRVTPIVPEARVNNFNINQFKTDIKFNDPSAPETVKPIPKVETPAFAVHDWARPTRGRTRFKTELGSYKRMGEVAWVKVKPEFFPEQAEVQAQLIDKTRVRIRGRNRLVRHYQLPDIRVDNLTTLETKEKTEQEKSTLITTEKQVVVEDHQQTQPQLKAEIKNTAPVEKRKKLKKEKKTTTQEHVIVEIDQKDKEAAEGRIAASMEAYLKAREIAPVVDGSLVAALHPDQYSYAKRLRSRKLQHRAKSDGSFTSYRRAIYSYRRPITTTAEAESLFRQFNDSNIPVEIVSKVTTRRANNREVGKVESGLEDQITNISK